METTKKQYKTIKTPLMEIRGMVKTLNDDARTVEVVFATDKPVRMYSWEEGHYLEELSMTGMRTDRLNSGAPLLDNHNSYSGTRGVLGAVVRDSVKIEGGKAIATVKFSSRADVNETYQDVKDGILSTLSVGYNVHRADLIKTENGINTYRAVDWEPFEISLAPIPADFAAQVRSRGGDGDESETEIEIIEGIEEPIETTDHNEPTDAEIRDAYWRDYYALTTR